MECNAAFYSDTNLGERKAKIDLMIAEASLKTAEANLKTAEAYHQHAVNLKELLATYISVCTHPVLDDLAKAAFKAAILHTVAAWAR